jgi:hypothetical protein
MEIDEKAKVEAVAVPPAMKAVMLALLAKLRPGWQPGAVHFTAFTNGM